MPKCSICGKEYKGFGNNPAPLNRGKCCDECNSGIIVPLRLFLAGVSNNRAMLIKTDGGLQTLQPKEKLLSLKQMQDAVGGYIEMYPKADERFHFVVNEEGLLKQLPFNELAFELFGIEIVGNLLLTPKGLIE